MGGNHFHYNGKRIYTPKEMVRLMSLPNDYQMTGDYNDKGARIGLMVAPLCLYYLVEEIKKQILEAHGIHYKSRSRSERDLRQMER